MFLLSKLKGKKKKASKFEEWLLKQNAKEIRNLVLDIGLMFAGLRAFKPKTPSQAVLTSLFGPVSLRLAQSPNPVAGTSGVIGLAALGLANTHNLGKGLLNELFVDEIKSDVKRAVGITKEEERFFEVTRGP